MAQPQRRVSQTRVLVLSLVSFGVTAVMIGLLIGAAAAPKSYLDWIVGAAILLLLGRIPIRRALTRQRRENRRADAISFSALAPTVRLQRIRSIRIRFIKICVGLATFAALAAAAGFIVPADYSLPVWVYAGFLLMAAGVVSIQGRCMTRSLEAQSLEGESSVD